MQVATTVRRVPALAWIAVLLAHVTGFVLALWPCSSVTQSIESSSGTGGGVTALSRSCSSLLQSTGGGVVIALAVPVGLAFLVVLGFAVRQMAVFITPTALLGVFCVLTGFSIGMFYLPTLVLLIIACATWSTSPR
jgi:hypothetical protein